MVLDPKRSDVAIKQLQSSVASIKKNQTQIDTIEGTLKKNQTQIDTIEGTLQNHRHETFDYDVTFNEGLYVDDIDYTISDTEYDELLNLLGGVVPRLIDWIYPVGHIISTTNASYDPNKLYTHQTWERYAKGQTLVGVDESDTDFATAGKTGGAKTHTLTTAQIPAHLHAISTDSNYVLGSTDALTRHTVASGSGQANMLKSADSAVSRMWKNTQNTGSGNAHNNLQPYITVYMWRRTA